MRCGTSKIQIINLILTEENFLNNDKIYTKEVGDVLYMFFRNYSKPGKGISKEDLNKSGVELYFDILFRRIWNMIKLNLLYVLVSIPAVIISALISLYLFTITASVKGIDINENATSLLILSILFAIAFFQITGSGPASVAKCYVLKHYVEDTHTWVISDFFEHMKKNFRQGITVYVINTLVITFLLLAGIFYSFILKNSFSSIFSTLILIIVAIFVMMQMYVYQLVARVELKVKHIYKNALALTIIKLPWNLFVLAVTIGFMYLMYYLSLTIPIISTLVILAIYFVIISFTQMFMINNVMNKYIIEPGMKK